MSLSETCDHWCNILITRVKQLLEENYKHCLAASLSDLLEEVMNILNTMIIKRENLHVEFLCRAFFNYKIESGENNDWLDSLSLQNKFFSILTKLE